jgi:pyruvate/2-oxoglutarate dehydrogenase complex dihydrolipoamide dehydrogenase (E3) component
MASMCTWGLRDSWMSNTVVAGEETLTARYFLLTTGAHPFIPPIGGLDGVDYLTHETVWNLTALPQHLLVVGGGPVGCELSQSLHRLGSKVTLFASRGQLLPREEAEAAQVLGEVFAAEGVDVRYGARVERVFWQDGDGVHVLGGGSEAVGDALLIAAGRRPNVDGMDLEKAGVAYSAAGIEVDDSVQTSQQSIYAAGDCTGGPQFTHYAGYQAFMAVRNALLPGSSRGVTDRVPWTTFTDPEVARVGMTEAQAREALGEEVAICHWPMDMVDRARTEGDTSGFMKLVHKRDGTLLGATIVAGRAGEAIHEWIVAMDRGLKVGDLANAIHIYPTYATASQQAAAAFRVAATLGGASGKILRGLARLMR